MQKPKQPRKINGEACWYPFWWGGSYCYDFYVEGQRYRQSTNVCDKASIKIAEGIAEAVHDAAWARALSSAPTLKEAAKLYVAEFGVHEAELEKIVGYFGRHIKIDEIDDFLRKQCAVELANSDVQPQTRRRQIKTPLLAVIRNAEGLRTEPQVDNVRERILTPDEAERLIQAAENPPPSVRDPDRRLLKMIAFMLGTGATPGETFCVMASDLFPDDEQVRIRGEHVGAGKTKYRKRTVRPPKRTWKLMGELPKSGRVFLSTTGREIVPDGKRGNTAVRQFRKLCDEAGLGPSDEHPERLVFYSLRHTWATYYSAHVKSERKLIERGGWKDSRMASRYCKRETPGLARDLRAHGWRFKK